MPGTHFALLALLCFVTSGISVVTGSTSAVTVPVMFQLGVDPRTAIATNMFALTFMSIGGTLPFLHGAVFDRRRLPVLIVLTLIGSAAGAVLLIAMPKAIIPGFVSASIIGLALYCTFYRQAVVESATLPPSRSIEIVGYILTFVLGVYGGLFSGGYVTILTAIFVATFRMSFIEAIATTKLINIFSSGIAAAIFMWRDLVDYRLGLALAAIMFAGALLGGRIARRIADHWLRRIYLAAVYILGLKTLLFDILLPHVYPTQSERS